MLPGLGEHHSSKEIIGTKGLHVSWIELQRAKAAKLTERAGLERRARALATKIAGLLGQAEDLRLATDATQAGVNNLIDELDRVEVDLGHVRAFEEIDAMLMLGRTSPSPEHFIRPGPPLVDRRYMIAAHRFLVIRLVERDWWAEHVRPYEKPDSRLVFKI